MSDFCCHMRKDKLLDALPFDVTVDSKTAADMLETTDAALRQRRVRGQLPRFVKVRRSVRYRLPDLAEFEDQR